MRLHIIVLALIVALSSYTHAASPVHATVQGAVDPCGEIFCLTLTATSDAQAGAPSFVEITVSVTLNLFATGPNGPCRMVQSDSTTRVFVGCELVVWEGHPASAIIHLTPVVHNGAVWITPSAFVFDPVEPIDIAVAPILVPVPFFTYTPLIRR